MKLCIREKSKKELFMAIFQTLKNCSSLISMYFKKECLFIQGMDKSHVCMFELCISNSWFSSYEVNEKETMISLDSQVFFTILNVVNDHYSIQMYQEEEDYLNIDLLTVEGVTGEFSKFFKIPLTDYDYDLLHLPSIEYDAEFSINSKKITEITNQMLIFGSDIQIQCSEEKINLLTTGIHGEMMVNIPIQDLTEYAICEGENINITYNLNYIHKMCISTKLCQELEISISLEYPLKIKYDLGKNSFLVFFIAPKVTD
jgi:proliferating cell nuclear antigen PCNA